jgi:hypothetical protein
MIPLGRGLSLSPVFLYIYTYLAFSAPSPPIMFTSLVFLLFFSFLITRPCIPTSYCLWHRGISSAGEFGTFIKHKRRIGLHKTMRTHYMAAYLGATHDNLVHLFFFLFLTLCRVDIPLNRVDDLFTWQMCTLIPKREQKGTVGKGANQGKLHYKKIKNKQLHTSTGLGILQTTQPINQHP